MKTPKSSSTAFEAALTDAATSRYVLRLYVAGGTPQSIRALINLKAICADYLKGRYQLEVIDVYQEPERAREEQILAVPTLIRESPGPLRRLIGDLSDTARVLHGLNLQPGATVDAAKDTRRHKG